MAKELSLSSKNTMAKARRSDIAKAKERQYLRSYRFFAFQQPWSVIVWGSIPCYRVFAHFSFRSKERMSDNANLVQTEHHIEMCNATNLLPKTLPISLLCVNSTSPREFDVNYTHDFVNIKTHVTLTDDHITNNYISVKNTLNKF